MKQRTNEASAAVGQTQVQKSPLRLRNIPNIPNIPNFPNIPNIPTIPNIPKDGCSRGSLLIWLEDMFVGH